MKTVKVKTWEW